MFLVATLLAVGLLVYFQLGNIKYVLHIVAAPENPNNVNKQLENIQRQNDEYNESIKNIQNQTDNVLETLKKQQ